MTRIRLQIAGLLVFAAALTPAVGSAQGLGLPTASFAAGGTGLTSFYVLGFELGPWQEYLAQELTPDFMLPDNIAPVRVSWLRDGDVLLLPDFANRLEPGGDSYFFYDFEFQSSADFLEPEQQPDALMQGSLFERRFFAPGIEHRVSDSGVLGVAAVIAYQRFSTASLGLMSVTAPESVWLPRHGFLPYEERGYGTGVKLTLRQQLFDRLGLESDFQSRIDMEEFAAYRGVYSNPADLDIPARARVGLAFQASARTSLRFAVERVLYSDINAFPSRYLPNRFLSLLGDSTSPAFEWNDLTVYSVGWTWSDGTRESWHVDYSSRQQPSPSSALLSQAIRSELADSALIVGYSRQTGKNHRLSVNAAYAPSEYAFGGSVLGVTTDNLDRRLEVEALWTMKF